MLELSREVSRLMTVINHERNTKEKYVKQFW